MIQLTDTARAKIEALVDAEVVRYPALRIALSDPSSPRSPLEGRYAISLVERDEKEKTEIAINLDGIRVLLNLDTSNLLSGATIGWGNSGFSVETPQPRRPAEVREALGEKPVSSELGDRVQAVLDELVNPRIAAHGGTVELVDVSDATAYVRMMGGCQGCSASAATLRMGVERMLKEEVPEVQEVVDVTDHASGTNPYYD
jgi:Fe/S biogenesis protein NfuA